MKNSILALLALSLATQACNPEASQNGANAAPAPQPAAQAANPTPAPEAKPLPKAAPQPASQADAKNSGYVEIADWCRSGLTEEISARDWAKASNTFGLKYLRTTNGNAVFSPYSIERALGMTLDGACGQTANEMFSALEMPNAKRLSMAGLAVDQALRSVNADTLLEIENTLWPDLSLTLTEDYQARVAAAYQNKIVQMDYRSAPEPSRVQINDAVAKATHDRIKDLIPKGQITGFTRLVLTNSIYFKSKWFNLFKDADTKDEDFYAESGKSTVRMMHRRDKDTGVCVSKDYAMYDLRFRSSDEYKGNYVLRIILPTIDAAHPMADRMKRLQEVESQLSTDMDCRFSSYNVNLSIPKFRLAPSTTSIKDTLRLMGMVKAFKEDAEFYAMTYQTKPADPSSLYIGDVFHKAFIEIDEQGGEAAAATAVVMVTKSIPMEPELETYDFKVDHPFLFMIIEESTGTALFMGRVTIL